MCWYFSADLQIFFKKLNLIFKSLKCFLLILLLFCCSFFSSVSILYSHIFRYLLTFLSFWSFLTSVDIYLPSIFLIPLLSINFKYYFMILIIIRIILWQSTSLFLNIIASFHLGMKLCLPVLILVTNLWVFPGLYLRQKLSFHKCFSPSYCTNIMVRYYSLFVHIYNWLFLSPLKAKSLCGFETMLHSSING